MIDPWQTHNLRPATAGLRRDGPRARANLAIGHPGLRMVDIVGVGTKAAAS
jgi:hypothetical protein